MARQPMGMARIFLIISAPLKGKETREEGGRRSGVVTWRRRVRRLLKADVDVLHCPGRLATHWLYKPSRQEMAVSVVHWFSVTGRLL